jgi:hypothetical protein
LHDETLRKISILDELVSAGVIPRRAVLHSLARAANPAHPEGGEEIADSAVCASFLLRRYSRSTFPVDDSKSFLWQLAANGLTADAAVSAAAILWQAKAITDEQRLWYWDRVVTETPEEADGLRIIKAMDLQKEINWRTLYTAWLTSGDGKPTHAQIKEIAQTLLRGEELDRLLPEIGPAIVSDKRLTKKERQTLAARWFEEWTGPVVAQELKTTEALLKKWPEGREVVAKAVAAKFNPSDMVEVWQGLSAVLGMSRTETRETVARKLAASTDPGGEAIKILRWQQTKGNRALLTEYQIAQCLVASLLEYGPRFNSAHLFDVVRLIDAGLAGRLLNTIEQHSPILLLKVIDARFEGLVDTNALVLKSFRSGDRADKLRVILRLPLYLGRLSSETAAEICGWAAENLTAGEAAESYGSTVFLYGNGAIRTQIVDRVFSVPGVAEELLRANGWWAQTCRNQMGKGRSIASSSESLLQLGASQTYKSRHYFQRRIAADNPHFRAVTGQALHPDELTAELREEHTPLMKRMAELDTSPSRSSEVRRLQIAALIARRHYTLPQTMQDAEEQAWQSAGELLGLTPGLSNKLKARLARENIDPIKVATWVQRSRSERVGEYLTEFFRQYALGKSVKAWKFAQPGGLEVLPPELLSRWKANQTRAFSVAGKQYKLKFTHALSSFYDIGEKPSVNCLHYGSGTRRDGLASMLSPEVKLIDVRDARGVRVANAIVRIGFGSRLVVLLEPVYMTTNDAPLCQAVHTQVMRTLEALVKDMNTVDLGLLSEKFHGDLRNNLAGAYEFFTAPRNYELSAGKTPYSYDDQFDVTSNTRSATPLLVSRRPQAKTAQAL